MHAALGTEGWELLRVVEDRGSNRCTAGCLDARQELRAAILGAVAEGQGTRRVSQAFGVSREVVRALRRQALESGELDQHKQSIGLDALALARECIGRIRDEIEEMPRQSLPIIAGVMVDKAQILTGGVTARVEHVQAPSHADLNSWLETLPRVEPVLSGEESAAKEGGGLELGPGAEGGDLGADTAGRVFEHSAQVAGIEVASDVSSPDFRPCSEGEAAGWAQDGREQGQKGGAA